MRFFIIFLGVAIFLLVAFTALKVSPDEDTPVRYAKQFLNRMQDGDYASAVSSFGGNICRCPADLGWVSYLIYASGEDPNLAFMMGKRFVRGGFDYKKMKTTVDKSKTTLLENPQDFEVDVPISFDPAIYAPYFLPLDMAYGLPTSAADLDAFIANPDQDAWKCMTLRLRPSLASGTVDTPEDAKKQIDHYIKDKKAREQEERESGKLHGKTATQEAIEIAAGMKKEALASSPDSKYLVPKDAGAVNNADGSTMSTEDVAKRLPRLKSVMLRLHMVRRDPVEPFTVFHFVVADPVLQVPENGDYKTVVLKNFIPPMKGVAVPAPPEVNGPTTVPTTAPATPAPAH